MKDDTVRRLEALIDDQPDTGRAAEERSTGLAPEPTCEVCAEERGTAHVAA